MELQSLHLQPAECAQYFLRARSFRASPRLPLHDANGSSVRDADILPATSRLPWHVLFSHSQRPYVRLLDPPQTRISARDSCPQVQPRNAGIGHSDAQADKDAADQTRTVDCARTVPRSVPLQTNPPTQSRQRSPDPGRRVEFRSRDNEKF